MLFNGVGYKLIRDGATARYRTNEENFLHIERHNYKKGNHQSGGLDPQNVTWEWWEVVTKDGTRWRLGWNTDSEQLAMMTGYPGDNTGAWAALGYAGKALHRVAGRWRADLATDVYGNTMTFAYTEEGRTIGGRVYDKASYLTTVSYNYVGSSPTNTVNFVLEPRPAANGSETQPIPVKDWDNWDGQRLDKIVVSYNGADVRTYDLSYEIRPHYTPEDNYGTTVLAAVDISGGGVNVPRLAFTYVDKYNRFACGSTCSQWPYPRLAAISNGWGGLATFTYGNDEVYGRTTNTWYNWRMSRLIVESGMAGVSPITTDFTYGSPCYLSPSGAWPCDITYDGELVGYAVASVRMKDSGGATLSLSSHYSVSQDEKLAGREYLTQNKAADGTILTQTNSTWVSSTTGLPAGVYFNYLSKKKEYVRQGGALVWVNETRYTYNTTTTGNLTKEEHYNGTETAPTLYRSTEYEYVTNTDPAKWYLDRLSRKVLKNAAGAILAEEKYGYDNGAPGVAPATWGAGELTLSQVINGAQSIDTGYDYDSYGNLIKTCAYTSYGTAGTAPATACDVASGPFRTTTTQYDSLMSTYPITVTNTLNQSVTTTYDYALGLPLTVTDPNGAVTTTTYDGLGRTLEIKYPGYTQANVKYTYPTVTAGGTLTPPFSIKAEFLDETVTPSAIYRPAWTIYDGLGRTLQAQGPYETQGNSTCAGVNCDWIVADTSYDARGQVWYTGQPRLVNGVGGAYFAPTWTSIPHTTTTYDALNRVSRTDFPDATFATVAYDGLKTTFIDPNSHKREQESDKFGRLWKVYEYTGVSAYTLYATTTYGYDERDLLKTVTDQLANVTTITYDNYGRKTAMTDPDMGAWSYGYDVLGNLTSQTDARNTLLSFEYDTLNRLTKKWQGPINTGTLLATYTYDSTANGNKGKGRRTGMTDAYSTANWTYNALGQVTDTTRVIGGALTYKTCSTYDAFGRLRTQRIPSTSNCTGELLTYNYNSMGALESVSGTATYVSQMNYEASGQVKETYLGNGVISQSCYDATTLRLVQIRAYPGSLTSCVNANPANTRFSLSYQQYDAVGNIKQAFDATRNETLNYNYDDLDRLLSVTGAYSQNFGYNAIGNLTNKAGVTLNYPASGPSSVRPHAVTSLSTGETYSYDANGNMTQRVEGGLTYTQNFNAENQLTSVTVSGQTTQFIYDGDGNLLSKVKPDGSATLYLGGLYEVDLTSVGAATKKTSYYPGGAMRVDIVGGANTLYYLLKDHLGSASTLLDSTGNLVTNGEQRYYPFGEKRLTSADLKTAHLFTGQLEVGLGGIYSYGARMYSPKLGRFLSADTVVPDWKYPQSLNRFSYTYNNPLKYVDPTGHRTECYGTGDFISESHDDGGISWGSCWARQRDKGILTDGGVAEKDAETLAAVADTYGVFGLQISGQLVGDFLNMLTDLQDKFEARKDEYDKMMYKIIYGSGGSAVGAPMIPKLPQSTAVTGALSLLALAAAAAKESVDGKYQTVIDGLDELWKFTSSAALAEEPLNVTFISDANVLSVCKATQCKYAPTALVLSVNPPHYVPYERNVINFNTTIIDFMMKHQAYQW